ncbi:ABC transporter ATP-binding protein [Evansella cellulosilytica]|uniref:ABC transporter related protein n=1 Tax=Evansella cellulosilytica (strain ATCC 21833 / DSM 2522 / FERM P-1141 / JCM 9156 / N-4) TaxID=649639 RepID=E6TVB7_EVAC2|nr:ABC transporter ATP-binding protein [Evansella cellulosilytica]ADU29801.1 ABC transporter related protein [Evansella cellulosilytica DSM 2522]
MESIVEVNDVKKKYRNFTLGPIHAVIPKGMITAIIGRNGAGKTTFLKGLCGLPPFNEGRVLMHGEEMNFSNEMIRSDIVYISNDIQMYSDFTIKQALDFIESLHLNWDDDWVSKWLHIFELSTNVQIHELSKGMKMKLNLILSMAHQPSLVLLDEPTDGLDSIARQQFIQLIQEYIEDGTKSIIISTHHTKEVEDVSDYILFFKDGRIKLYGDVMSIKDKYRTFSVKADREVSKVNGVTFFEKTSLEVKGVIHSECIDALKDAVFKVPSLDDLFYFVVEKGGNM